jgi:hypothetical protein
MLSGAGVSRSDAPAESKHPYLLSAGVRLFRAHSLNPIRVKESSQEGVISALATYRTAAVL